MHGVSVMIQLLNYWLMFSLFFNLYILIDELL